MTATNINLTSAVAKATAIADNAGKGFEGLLTGMKLMNLIAPLPMSGFRVYSQSTFQLTAEESDAFYREYLAHPASKCTSVEEVYAKFPEEAAQFEKASGELCAEGKMASQAEMQALLEDELGLQPDVALAYAVKLGFPVELTAEQQAAREAYDAKEAANA